jgi:hypothetical protein
MIAGEAECREYGFRGPHDGIYEVAIRAYLSALPAPSAVAGDGLVERLLSDDPFGDPFSSEKNAKEAASRITELQAKVARMEPVKEPVMSNSQNDGGQSEARFTRGPWTVLRSKHLHDGQHDYAINATKARVLAEAFGRDSHGNIINAEANAHLISAAPDMYEALKLARDCIWTGGDTISTLAKIDAALSKALGSPDPARSVDEQGRGTAA